jgi:large subunit ribosomal protein L3
MKSIIGKKVGMTSIFDSNGRQTAVTIIEAGPCVVTQKKTVETDGYNAVQIAFGDKKEKHTLLSEKSHFAKANTPAKKFVKEIRDSETDKNVGDTIGVDIFAEGDKIFMVLVSNLTDSTTGQEPRDLSAVHHIRQGYSKECVWQAAWGMIKCR